MFARKVAARLQPDSLKEFTDLIEVEVVPWLRTQEGFLDLIILAAPDGSEIATISFWDHEGNAQAFDSSGYPEAVKLLGKLLDGVPYVKTFDVVSSTLQRLADPTARDTVELVRDKGSAEIGHGACETRI